VASNYRQPEFLSPCDQPVHRIRCPIHGFIRFSDNERRVIDHPLFRRLRWIRQLALTELVYPGATHTRFEHSLGVMEIATRIFDALAREQGELMERTFASVNELSDKPLAKARQLVRLAALLHDVGHCCFSHAAEEVIHRDSDHESLTIRVLERPELLGETLDRLFFPGAGAMTAKIVGGIRQGLQPQMQVLKDIVSGQVDADRTDYLLRDSHHCGVDYGLFDHRRMIECLKLREADSAGLEIAIQRDGIHTFEALILARYQMNTQVYYHRLRRIYDIYLKEYFRAKSSTRFDTADKVLRHNDITMMAEILADADREGEPQQPWARRIRDRNHHREVFSTDEDAGAAEIRKVKAAFEKVRTECPGTDFRWDISDVSIHKLLLPDDKNQEQLVEFFVVERDGTASPLGERSHILRRIPRWFQVARIFADVPSGTSGVRTSIENRCKALAQN